VATGVRLGFVHAFGDSEVIAPDKFFAGGANTVRGYAEDSLGPYDPIFGPTGGNAMLVINQEFRFPIYRWVRGVGFLDAGNVFAFPSDLSLKDLKVSLGFGLRLDTPFALLRIDFGAPVPRMPNSRFGRWYFSLGNIF
jgi:outer membrane translocation and assembly module TamA